MDGLTPEEITGIKDLIRLPIISKKDFEEDLLQNPPFGTYQGDFPAIRIQASSGTRGKSKPFFQTQHDWNVIANFWARRLSAQGVKPGDIVQIVFTYSLFIAGFTATEGAIRLGALVVPSGSGAVTPSERQVGIAKDWGTTVLVGTPTYILHLADVAEKMGLDTRKDFHLRISVHTAEALTEAMRRAIEERWKVQAYDSFGSVETGAPTFECEEKNGYHINEDGYLFEILDPKTLKPVPAGKDGLIVVTSLFKEAAPVIRYNLEDISSFVDEPCPCGRTLKRLAKIRGRLDEMIKIRGVAFYPTVIESILERWPQLTSEYLLILDRVGNREKATLKVEHSASDPGKDNLKEKLERDLKVATGLSIEAELLGHGELKRVLNMEERIKAKRVVDRRNE
jgi:phenylacetate-CoA ligase